MVNKTAIGILGVVVVASLGVGVLIGMQLGGGADGSAVTNPTTADEPETPVNGATNGDDETPATEAPDEGQTEQRTPIPARQFDEAEIASHVAQFVNEERERQNRTELGTGDRTATRVSRMAGNHSVAMANAGRVAHEVDGDDTASRYTRNGLFERCKFKSAEGSYISQPDEEFELLGTTYAGQAYDDNGSEQFNGDERSVARAIVDDWNESSTDSERLAVEGPTRMGVGVEVTNEGQAFATVAVCA